MTKVLTTSEAVREFRMHPATVLRLILTRRVGARKDGNGRWLVQRSDLEKWSRSRIRRAPRSKGNQLPRPLLKPKAPVDPPLLARANHA